MNMRIDAVPHALNLIINHCTLSSIPITEELPYPGNWKPLADVIGGKEF